MADRAAISPRIFTRCRRISEHLSDRLSISDGTLSARVVTESPFEYPYSDEARVPVQEWRRLSAEEYRRTQTADGSPEAWILRVPECLLEKLVRHGVHDIKRQCD